METLGDLKEFIEGQVFIAALLQAVDGLGLDDCWIGAGLIRNAVWDRLHGIEPALVSGSDVDVVFCDHQDSRLQRDLDLLADLNARAPAIPWSVHNQARMHCRNGDRPYRDVADAIARWPETATAIAARWRGGRTELLAPHGIGDLLGLTVRPTPAFNEKIAVYRKRIAAKDWQRRWPKLKILSGQ